MDTTIVASTKIDFYVLDTNKTNEQALEEVYQRIMDACKHKQDKIYIKSYITAENRERFVNLYSYIAERVINLSGSPSFPLNFIVTSPFVAYDSNNPETNLTAFVIEMPKFC